METRPLSVNNAEERQTKKLSFTQRQTQQPGRLHKNLACPAPCPINQHAPESVSWMPLQTELNVSVNRNSTALHS